MIALFYLVAIVAITLAWAPFAAILFAVRATKCYVNKLYRQLLGCKNK